MIARLWCKLFGHHEQRASFGDDGCLRVTCPRCRASVSFSWQGTLTPLEALEKSDRVWR